MPGLNRQGPKNQGAMTGRRMGRCNPNNKGKTNDEILNESEKTNEIEMKDFGFGRRLGRGQGQGQGKGLGLRRGMGMRFRGNA
jgi:hypothetical protein